MIKKEIRDFLMAEDAVSTVEIVLIVVVLIALVVLFKSQIVSGIGATAIESLT